MAYQDIQFKNDQFSRPLNSLGSLRCSKTKSLWEIAKRGHSILKYYFVGHKKSRTDYTHITIHLLG